MLGLALLTLTSPLVVNAATFMPANNMTLLGVYGGAMSTITVDSGHAYIGQGTLVAIASLANPTTPQRVGQSESLPSAVRAIAVRQGYVYAALGEEGLSVIDARDPTNPSVVGSLDTPGIAVDAIITGSLLLVADGPWGLRIFDVSTPAQPTATGNLDTPGNAQRLTVVGNLVYIADGSGGARIVDITTPATPTEIGFFDSPDETVGVAYGNNYLYLADSPANLRVVDVSDPTQPSEISVSEIDYYNIDDVMMVDNNLFVRLDVSVNLYSSNPNGPSQTADILSGYFLTDLAVAGDYAYITDSRYGLHIIDINPPTTPTKVGLLRSLSKTASVAIRGNLAYADDDFTGVALLDISNPAHITETLRFGIEPRIQQQVTIAGDTLIRDGLYIVPGGENRRLYFYSLANPQSPQSIGERQVLENYSYNPRVATRNNHIFVANDQNGVIILDANDPAGEPVSLFDPDGRISSIAAPATSDWIAASSDQGLIFVDLSAPDNPQPIGEFAGNYGPADGAGDLVFAYNIATYDLDIINVQNVAAAQVVGSIDLPGSGATQILAANNLVWVANLSAGVRVIDVSTPAAPVEIAFFDPPGWVRGLAVAGTRVYLATDEMGLLALRLDAPTALDESEQPSHWRLALPMLAR
jgi:hypothetical protein